MLNARHRALAPQSNCLPLLIHVAERPVTRDVRAACLSVEPEESLVLVMGPDPEPVEHIILKQGDGAIPIADADRPDVACLLELKGRMARVPFPQLIDLPRPRLDPRWQSGEGRPEIRSCR